MAARASATRQLLDTLDPATRLAMEGHRPGTYVRMRFSGGWCRESNEVLLARVVRERIWKPVMSTLSPATEALSSD